ncbi:hypothetical protein F9Y90_00715 [Borrelia miyamotoi]|uniref:Uncharacterized protein n=1 Tax=Borrelia miyamotoi TaxID=47466 RepID=A0AAX3JKV8_9SPIR|nr:hypothetical protein [Borrelia miyamotoi]QFP41667.1 hypothetical protein F9Y90_00715 [Borrelia miyamotoi]QFP47787.1 hypothetical protein F9Y91_00710 [Borrelia miyamotoi]QGT55547.1 hypothetical protein GNY89_00720 [Borrelia miyamotoi]QGT56329.1 hypothetical protein GNY88_00720 [Borrelia miyamotoi]WAZ71576.1 hypothetical protein O5404_00720 [Borrelia miyamotoi]
MKSFKENDLRLFSIFIRVLVLILFLNALLGLFIFLAGAYNVFMYSLQKFSLEFSIVLSAIAFGLEATRLIFFYIFLRKRIKNYIILMFSFIICFLAFFIKIFLSLGI